MKKFSSNYSVHKIIFVTVMGLFLNFHAHAVTGNEYRELSNSHREGWVAGAVDGLLAEYVFILQKKSPILDCVSKMERNQIKAIFEKSLDANPEKWGFPAVFILRQSLYAACN
jgi:hypothetical protein